MEASMHALQAITVVAVLLVGLSVKPVFFPAADAGANKRSVQSASLNTLHTNFDRKNVSLPIEKFHDMTFVYSEND